MRRSIVGIISGCVLGNVSLQGAPIERFKGDNHWDLYGDFLYMERSKLKNITLVKEGGSKVMSTKDLIHEFSYEPGYRVGALYSANTKYGMEGVYSSLGRWEGYKSKRGHESLRFPFNKSSYDVDFIDASEAKGRYTNHLWDTELNFWRYFSPRLKEYFGLSGLIGLRYFNWAESFRLEMDASHYKIKTRNRIGGLQLGLDFQMHPTRWLTWELQSKLGMFANSTKQSQFLGDFSDTITVRHSSTTKWQGGLFGDISAQMRIECTRWMNLHVGYEFMILSGLSLAPEQVSKDVGVHAGEKNHTHGRGIIQGLFAGLTFRL